MIASSGVPYSDTFDVRLKRVIESVDESIISPIVDKIQVKTYLFVNFNQNVMIKSTIESKTFETTKESIGGQNQERRTYLKMLEKKMMKGGKRESPEDRFKDQEMEIQELVKSVKTLKEEKNMLEI